MTTDNESSGKPEKFVKILTGDMFFCDIRGICVNQSEFFRFDNRVKKNAHRASF